MSITGPRTLPLGQDNDNQVDSGDQYIGEVIVANSGDEGALTVELDADENGDTIGNVQIGLIGVDDTISVASRESRDQRVTADDASHVTGDTNGTASVAEPLVVITREAFDKLVRLAHKVASDISVETPPLIRPAGGAGKRGEECQQTASELFARRLYRFRRLRANYFNSELFSEPAWDILLDLFLNQVAGRQVCVSSCCIAAATPVTTGLRWLKHLEACGFVVRESDPVDARRTHVSLSPEGFDRMRSLLQDGRRLLEPAVANGMPRGRNNNRCEMEVSLR